MNPSRQSFIRESVNSILNTISSDITDTLNLPGRRKVLWSVIHLGLSFAILFAANIVQYFLTTLYGFTGFISLAAVQFFFGIGSLLAPLICNSVGYIKSMTLGAISYALLTISVNSGSNRLLLVASILNGFGAALLWVSQAVWLTKITVATGEIGSFTGIFFTLFNFGSIIGNVLFLGLQFLDIGMQNTVWILGAVAVVGCILIAFATPVDVNYGHETTNIEGEESQQRLLNEDTTHAKQLKALSKNEIESKRDTSEDESRTSTRTNWSNTPNTLSFIKRIKYLMYVLRKKQMLLLLPYIFGQGLALSYSAGNLPVFAAGNNQLISSMLLSFGIAASIMSYISGKMCDKFGMEPLLALHVIIVVFQYSCLILAIDPLGLPKWICFSHLISEKLRYIILIILGASYGFLDYLINTLLNVSISTHFSKHDMPYGFSIFRFFACVGYAISAAFSSSVSDAWIALANIIICVVSIVCYLYFRKTVEEKVKYHIGGSIIDPTRMSVASIPIFGPARPSVLGFGDVIEKIEEENMNMISDSDMSDDGYDSDDFDEFEKA